MILILGSSSPRRKELLSEICNNITIIVPDVHEKHIPGELPVDFARRISREKAYSVYKRIGDKKDDILIITGDTIVEVDNTILGKPEDYNDAKTMLTRLSNKTHRVISALSLLYLNRSETYIKTGHSITNVTFKDLNDIDIEKYLSLITYSDKAGSYAIQEHGHILIKDVVGSYSNVIGFPLSLFYTLLAELGITQKCLFSDIIDTHALK